MTDRLLTALQGACAREAVRRNPGLSDRDKLARYDGRPVDFSREVLQTPLWGDRNHGQAAMAYAVSECDRVAACTATKVGKTTMLAAIALWLYVLGWRVFISAPTYPQLHKALWREVRRLHALSTLRLFGKLSVSPLGGLHDQETLAHIVGLVGDRPEAFQGMSGSKMAFLVDEAPGIPDEIIQAIAGNLTGGGKLVMCGNPNRLTGEFYDAFHSKQSSYKTFEISALEVPLSASLKDPSKPPTAGNRTGLTLPSECEAFRQQYGEASPFYQVRVLGKFMIAQEGRVMPVGYIEAAHQAWEMNDVPDDGELIIGLDPAGPDGEGDDSAFAIRRGNRILEIVTARGLGADGHATYLRGLIRKHGREGDKRYILVDASGIGQRTYQALRQLMQGEAAIIAVYGSAAPIRATRIYKTRRDELHGALAERAKDGRLELPPSARLDQDLNAAKWEYHIDGRLKATDKRQLRKELGRSPDLGDAVMLAMWWVPSTVSDQVEHHGDAAPDIRDPYAAQEATIFDQFDPYSGQ